MRPFATALPFAILLAGLSGAPALAGGLAPPIVQAAPSAPAALPFAEVCPGVETALEALARQGFGGFVLRLGEERARIEARGPDGVARAFGWDCRTGDPSLRARGPGRAAPAGGGSSEREPLTRRVAEGGSSTGPIFGRTPEAPAAGDTPVGGAPVGGGGTPVGAGGAPATGGTSVTGGAPVGGAPVGGGGTPVEAGGSPVGAGGGSSLAEGGAAPGGTGEGVAPPSGSDGSAAPGGSGGRCGDREDDENNSRHDDCGHGNNGSGEDPDNPGQGGGRGPAGGRGDGPGLGGVGGGGGQGAVGGRGA